MHRDFKSDNVLLVPGSDGAEARVVVTDFGLARQSFSIDDTQPLTPQSRTVLGTLDYMSPEQVMGKQATPASDIYSLGIVIYEMLTGELPFRGDSPLARTALRVTRPAPRLDAALPRVAASASVCVARCLETDPDRRFATVDDVMAALRGEDVALRRSLALTVAASTLGALLLLAAVAYFVTARTRPGATPVVANHAPSAISPSLAIPIRATSTSPATPSATGATAPERAKFVNASGCALAPASDAYVSAYESRLARKSASFAPGSLSTL